MEHIWKKVKKTLKSNIPDHSYKMWIEPLELYKYSEVNVVLSSPNFYSKKRVLGQYSKIIEKELIKVSGRRLRLLIETGNNKNRSTKSRSSKYNKLPGLYKEPQKDLPNMGYSSTTGKMLRKNYTFENFIVGKNNDFAYSKAHSLASKNNSNNTPLFLLSKIGMGKTHLSQAMGYHILDHFPDDKVFYVSAEDFKNEMVNSFQKGSINKFKKKYRNNCDVLFLEDVHFLTGKEQTQNELSRTLDHFFEMNKKVIFTSCFLPGEIPKMNEHLRSRLSYSLVSKMHTPNFRTRVRILRQKAKENGYIIPDEINKYLAGELSENIRQLENGLMRVSAKSSLLGVPIDIDLAESVVKHIIGNSKNITIDAIKKIICKEFSMSMTALVSKSRKQSIVRPRQLAIYLSRQYTDQPLQAIGKSFNRYHATALHSIGTIERELNRKGPLLKQVNYLCEKIESGNFQ